MSVTRICKLVALLWLMLAAEAEATTRYVATNGLDSRTCAQSENITLPKLTLASAIACMSAGDTLYIRSGTYAQRILTVPSGTSFANAVTIAEYPGDSVTLAPTAADTDRVIDLTGTHQYVIFKDFKIDAAGVGYGAWLDLNARHIRFDGIEIVNGGHNGVLLPAQTSEVSQDIQFLSCNVHDNGGFLFGGQYGHGLYIGTAENIVDGCNVHANGAYGIQIYSENGPPSRNKVRNNRIYNNKTLDPNGGGMTITGDDNQVYNNLIYQNLGGGIYNTFNGPQGSLIMNNSVWSNSSDAIFCGSGASGVISNNLVYQNGAGITQGGCSLQTNQTANPSFVDAASGDFHLLAISSAIDVGTTRTEFTTDYEGTPRPQAAAWDRGADEFGGGGGGPPPVGKLHLHLQLRR